MPMQANLGSSTVRRTSVERRLRAKNVKVALLGIVSCFVTEMYDQGETNLQVARWSCQKRILISVFLPWPVPSVALNLYRWFVCRRWCPDRMFYLVFPSKLYFTSVAHVVCGWLAVSQLHAGRFTPPHDWTEDDRDAALVWYRFWSSLPSLLFSLAKPALWLLDKWEELLKDEGSRLDNSGLSHNSVNQSHNGQELAGKIGKHP